MGDYNNYPRNVLNTPHPMYGLPPGFSIADLPTSQNDGVLVFDQITVATTSPAIEIGANSIEMAATFTDLHTSCDLAVYKDDGVTLLATFTNVSTLKSGNLYVGFNDQRILIGGGALVFKVTNWSGTGKLTLKVRRTG